MTAIADQPGKQPAAPDSGSQSGAALRRQLCRVWECTSQLETERHALEEVRDGLKAEEYNLSRRLAAVEEQCRDSSSRIETNERHITEVDTEIQSLNQKIMALNHLASATERRLAALTQAVGTLEHQLASQKGETLMAEAAAEQAVGSALRMDYKLRYGRLDGDPVVAARARRGAKL